MPARVLAFLLAIAMAAGLASSAAAASPDMMAQVQVDDGVVEPDPVITELPVALVAPARREVKQIVVPPAELQGRLHRAWVFRPPR